MGRLKDLRPPAAEPVTNRTLTFRRPPVEQMTPEESGAILAEAALDAPDDVPIDDGVPRLVELETETAEERETHDELEALKAQMAALDPELKKQHAAEVVVRKMPAVTREPIHFLAGNLRYNDGAVCGADTSGPDKLLTVDEDNITCKACAKIVGRTRGGIFASSRRPDEDD